MSPAAPAVRISGLAKRYGRQAALSGVDLEVAAGEALCLAGANGAGKTTLIKCVLDLCAADAGSAEIFGMPAGLPASRGRLAYLPERFVPPHYLLGREFLELTLALSGQRYAQERAEAACTALELDPAALNVPVRRLSKGMTQKLGLAACFLLERDLYLLDEPLSGLDPAARAAAKSGLQRLRGEGRTLFFTSHVLADAEELCDALAVLERGTLRFRGAPAELRRRTGAAGLEQAFLQCIRGERLAA